METELYQLKADLETLLEVQEVPLTDLQEVFQMNFGYRIDYEKFGYDCLDDLLEGFCDIVRIAKSRNGSVVMPQNEDVKRLIQEQMCVAEEFQENRADVPKENCADVPKENRADVPKEKHADLPKENRADVPKENRADVPKENPADIPKENRADVPKENHADVPRENRAVAPREAHADAPREGLADFPKEDRSSQEYEDNDGKPDSDADDGGDDDADLEAAAITEMANISSHCQDYPKAGNDANSGKDAFDTNELFQQLLAKIPSTSPPNVHVSRAYNDGRTKQEFPDNDEMDDDLPEGAMHDVTRKENRDENLQDKRDLRKTEAEKDQHGSSERNLRDKQRYAEKPYEEGAEAIIKEEKGTDELFTNAELSKYNQEDLEQALSEAMKSLSNEDTVSNKEDYTEDEEKYKDETLRKEDESIVGDEQQADERGKDNRKEIVTDEEESEDYKKIVGSLNTSESQTVEAAKTVSDDEQAYDKKIGQERNAPFRVAEERNLDDQLAPERKISSRSEPRRAPDLPQYQKNEAVTSVKQESVQSEMAHRGKVEYKPIYDEPQAMPISMAEYRQNKAATGVHVAEARGRGLAAAEASFSERKPARNPAAAATADSTHQSPSRSSASKDVTKDAAEDAADEEDAYKSPFRFTASSDNKSQRAYKMSPKGRTTSRTSAQSASRGRVGHGRATDDQSYGAVGGSTQRRPATRVSSKSRQGLTHLADEYDESLQKLTQSQQFTPTGRRTWESQLRPNNDGHFTLAMPCSSGMPEAVLKEIFQSYGSVVDVYKKGNDIYVDYADKKGAAKALDDMSYTYKLKITDDCNTRPGEDPYGTKVEAQHFFEQFDESNTASIYIGNIPSDLSRDDILAAVASLDYIGWKFQTVRFNRHALIFFKSIEDAGTAVLALEDVTVQGYEMEVQLSHDTERLMRLMQTSSADYLRVVSEPVAQDTPRSRTSPSTQPKPRKEVSEAPRMGFPSTQVSEFSEVPRSEVPKREILEQPRRGVPEVQRREFLEEPLREFLEPQSREIPEKPKQGTPPAGRNNGRDGKLETDSWLDAGAAEHMNTSYNGARPKHKIDGAYLTESLSKVTSSEQSIDLGEWQNTARDELSLDQQEEEELWRIEQEIEKLKKRREEILKRQRQRHVAQTEEKRSGSEEANRGYDLEIRHLKRQESSDSMPSLECEASDCQDEMGAEPEQPGKQAGDLPGSTWDRSESGDHTAREVPSKSAEDEANYKKVSGAATDGRTCNPTAEGTHERDASPSQSALLAYMMSGEDEQEPAEAAAAEASDDRNYDNNHLPRSMRVIYPTVMQRCFGAASLTNHPVGSVVTVIVTNVERMPDFFWAQIKGKELNLFAALHSELQEKVNGFPGLGEKQQKCVALYQNEWFRCWLIERLPHHRARVFYIDYGNEEVVPEVQCRSLPDDYWVLPPQARPFHMKDHYKSSMKVDEEVHLNIAHSSSVHITEVYIQRITEVE